MIKKKSIYSSDKLLYCTNNFNFVDNILNIIRDDELTDIKFRYFFNYNFMCNCYNNNNLSYYIICKKENNYEVYFKLNNYKK